MSLSHGIDRRTLLATAFAAAAATGSVAAAPVETYSLWPGQPPGGEHLMVTDAFVRRSPNGSADDIAWPHVATPKLIAVAAARPTGAAVLLCPGGAYSRVALGRNGSEIARMFAARGITAFDLLYRLPHDGWAAGPDAPLQDAQRAMRWIRANAARWQIDPARVAACGFSAGGHLAARLGSRASLQTYAPIDAIDQQSARPVALGLFFPVITLLGPAAHATSKRELLGSDLSDARIRQYSAEADLSVDMPPSFLALAANDPVVPPANSLIMFEALQKAHIPSELMVFEQGGHSLPLVRPDGTPHPWPQLFLDFARRHGLGV
jgi:acetyl esterase/lipase